MRIRALKPPLYLEDCIEKSIKDGTITEKESEDIIEYAQESQQCYWEMHWGDIEEQNGMTKKQAKAFAKFYNKYKKNENVSDWLGEKSTAKWILFECSVYN